MSYAARAASTDLVTEIVTAVRILQRGESGPVEARIFQPNGSVLVGYFDDPAKLAQAVVPYNGTSAIYLTLNQVATAALARAANRLVKAIKGPAGVASTSDADIIRRRWLFFDIDPSRTSGVSSTEGEKADALVLLNEIIGYLRELGWPDPVEADSGNGFHALYAVDVPNTTKETAREIAELFKRVLHAVATRFNTATTSLDENVFNAGRITKCYGTQSIKGDSTPDRPHRRCFITRVPEPIQIVTDAQLRELAGSVSPDTRRPEVYDGRGPAPDLVTIFRERGLYKRPLGDGKHGVICPRETDGEPHADRDTTASLFEPKGPGLPWGFKCFECGELNIKDVLQYLRAAGALSTNGHGAHVSAAETPAPPAASEPLRVPADAMIGVGRDFADLYAEHLESPLAFFYFVFLTYFGSLIAQKVTLETELRPEPRLYTVVIGESADTRKSTALRVVDGFFRTLGSPWEPAVLFGVGSAEGLAAELKERPTLILHYDEFKSFVDKAKNEHSVALPMVTTLFERGEYDNRTKTERVSVRGAALSLVAACTGDTYATMFDSRFFAIGLLNRLWLVSDRSSASIAVPTMIPDQRIEGIRERVRAVLTTVDSTYERNGLRPVAFRLTPAGLGRFREWYEAREGSIFERRLDTYAHRLMVLLTVTTGRTIVDEEIVDAVITLLGYQLAVRRECDPVDADSAIAEMEEKIRRALARGAMKRRDLQRKVHYDRAGLWVWNTALVNLQRAGEVASDGKTEMVWMESVTTPVTTSVTTPKTGKTVNDDEPF